MTPLCHRFFIVLLPDLIWRYQAKECPANTSRQNLIGCPRKRTQDPPKIATKMFRNSLKRSRNDKILNEKEASKSEVSRQRGTIAVTLLLPPSGFMKRLGNSFFSKN